jgi:hypothetical protein
MANPLTPSERPKRSLDELLSDIQAVRDACVRLNRMRHDFEQKYMNDAQMMLQAREGSVSVATHYHKVVFV